jgi:transcriptional regulator with XRE-family HTH domain
MFGEELKALRLTGGLSLRDFCKATGEDPSNWSKVERGILPPPTDEERLDRIASILGVSGENISEFIARAVTTAGSLPKFVMTNEMLLSQLPAFLRTIDNVKPTEDDFKKIIYLLKKDYNAE